MESNIELVEKLKVVAEDIPILFDSGKKVGFHDQLVGLNMEIVEHLVIDDPVAIGGELYVVEHLVVTNEMVGVESLEYVDGDLRMWRV